MGDWPKDATKFRVKVSYRQARTRCTLAVPPPILAAFGYPDYVIFEQEQDGKAIVKPLKSEITK